MCGIIGYVGPQGCTPILLEGLRRLEYRGYDSAGVAVINPDGDLQVRRTAGKLERLSQQLANEPLLGHIGIGHTRWATHGRPTENNAHPHQAGDIVLVHNGIIENHLALKKELIALGHTFRSETDTEILSHLIQSERASGSKTFSEAVRSALLRVRGSYAVVVLDRSQPDQIVAAKTASPLVIGMGQGENFVASDIPAVLNHTRQFVFLGEGEMATLGVNDVVIQRIDTGDTLPVKPTRVEWTPAMAEKGGYKHFMLKEIHEQPRALADTIGGRISEERNTVELNEVHLSAEEAQQLQRIVVVACGTSWHAGLVGEYFIEALARIPVEVDLGSEYRYRDPILGPGTLVIAISQSGETADTLAALRLARSRGSRVLSICNVLGSSIARESDDVIYTHAGPEVGVASTKAFSTQLASLLLLAIRLGQLRGVVSENVSRELLSGLVKIPGIIEDVLRDNTPYVELARHFGNCRSMLYLGRGPQYPIALEGALKLKEISYIHAEGYASGEIKHGPIALIDETVPTVVVIPCDAHYEKSFNNLQEIRARGGKTIAIASEGDNEIADHADFVISVPRVHEALLPLITTVPMQLIAYCIADFKGTDVDQPRNLAKSVTVE